MANHVVCWCMADEEGFGLTNGEVGRRIGCHFTMASRLRNGKRVPSVAMLAKIILAFDPGEDALSELWSMLSMATSEEERASFFGTWMRKYIFCEPAEPLDDQAAA